MVTKLHRHIPHDSRMCPIDFRVTGSGQGHSAGISENCFKCITAFPLHLWSHNFTHRLFMSQGYALLISRSKGQGHSALISQNGFQHKNVFPLHLWSRNFRHRIPMTQGCALSKPDTQKCRFRWSCTVYHFCGTSEAKHYIAITLSTVCWSVCLPVMLCFLLATLIFFEYIV